jgi:hypothetical protein
MSANRAKIAKRARILRDRTGAELGGFRRGVRRELAELITAMNDARDIPRAWLTLAHDMRREGYLPAARLALDYARTARLVAGEVHRITSTRAWERA